MLKQLSTAFFFEHGAASNHSAAFDSARLKALRDMLSEIAIPARLPQTSCRETLHFLRDADQRISDFRKQQHPPIHNFVACDFVVVDSAIEWIVAGDLQTSDRFCEWGSGFGVVTMLAARHGLEACGIEIELDLIQAAEQLAEDYEFDTTFAHGSFIPEIAHDMDDEFNDIHHVATDHPSAYDELDYDIDSFDLFFAFPWPGEEHYWETIFDRFAATGALLLTYHGIDQMRLQRKVS